jgi:3-hydroxyisobutyrate dehydrogenase-like beta-hydroxyacid dehydrogenase
MLGCDSPEAIDRAMPLFKAMGKYIFPMGNSGSGHAMKTLNNYVSVGSIIALCDSLVAGQKFGLDPATMIDVLNVECWDWEELLDGLLDAGRGMLAFPC